MNKELSDMYKLGYKRGFQVAIFLLKKNTDSIGLINKLINDYNKYPMIEKFNDKELCDGEIK